MDNFKGKFFDIFRNYLKKHFTGNLGTVVEEEDKLICYVKQGKWKKEKYNYNIPCFGISKEEQNLASDFKLNKPISYVIDGIKNARKKIYIFGYNDCEIIVRNCSFNNDVMIHVNGKCTLEKTFIRMYRSLMIGAKEMTIKNMNIKPELIRSNLRILIDTRKNLNITDSYIGEKNKLVDVDISSDNELDVINSQIMGNKINVAASIMNVDDSSSLIALKSTDIKANNLKKLNIDSPEITFNGNVISTYGKTVQLKRVDNPLTNERLKLIDVLKKLRDNCAEINNQIIEKINSKPVSKILKK